MAENVLNVRLIQHHGTSFSLSTTNPVLLKGEVCYVVDDTLDNGKYKIGDGLTPWNSLSFIGSNNTIENNGIPTSSMFSYDIGTLCIDTVNNDIYILLDNTVGNAVWMLITQRLEEFTASEINDIWIKALGEGSITNGYRLHIDNEPVLPENDDIWIGE